MVTALRNRENWRRELQSMARDGPEALVVLSDAQFNAARRQIIELAAVHRLPTMYEAREFVSLDLTPRAHPRATNGCTKSSSMASGSWPGAMPPASAC